MSRIWNLRLNVDEFNSVYGSAYTDAERSLVLTGLFAGINSGTPPEQCSRFVLDAFTIARAWREEAEQHLERKSRAGKASAESREKRFGGANPRLNCEQDVNTVQVVLEQNVNQSTIPNPLTVQPPTPPKKKKDRSSIPEEFRHDLEVLCSDWPSKSKKKEGGFQALRKWTDPPDLWEAMTKYFPNDDPALMIKCGLVYLDEILPEPGEFDLRQPEPPAFCYAMCNFYGPKLAYWKLKKEAARAKMEKQQ